jgi:hypothetical protein
VINQKVLEKVVNNAIDDDIIEITSQMRVSNFCLININKLDDNMVNEKRVWLILIFVLESN